MLEDKVKKKALYALCAVVLTLALTGCEGMLVPSSSPAPVSIPFPEEPLDELEQLKQALPPIQKPTPSLFPSALPDLTPPPGGWIAFRTPEGRLALISSDASRVIPLTDQGEVTAFTWSPDGRWLAFTIDLGGFQGGQLALVSIENSRLIPLTGAGAVASGWLTWSQDSRSLAYLYNIDLERAKHGSGTRSPLALRLFDLSTHQMITLTTYSNNLLPDPEIPSLCPQAFPSPLLPVILLGGPSWGSLHIWDTRAKQRVVDLGSMPYCQYLWLPEGEGMVFAKIEFGKEGIWHEEIAEVIYPVSLALGRVGEETPVVVLEGRKEGTKQWNYAPVHWLPDGRLVVSATLWEERESGPPVQARVEYRFFYVDEEGELRETKGGDLPWWAAGGFQERLAVARLPQSIGGVSGLEVQLRSGWEVGPDGEAVIFTWRWMVDEEQGKSAIYLWRGEGEPMCLSMGEYPQWQPKGQPESFDPGP